MTQDLNSVRPSGPEHQRPAVALPSSPAQIRRPPSASAGPVADRSDPGRGQVQAASRPVAGSAVPRFAPPGWRPGDAPASGWAVRPPPSSGRGPANVDTRPDGARAQSWQAETGNVDTRPTEWPDHERHSPDANVDTGPARPSPLPAYAQKTNVDTHPGRDPVASEQAARPFESEFRSGPALGAPSFVPEPDGEMSDLVEARRRRISQRREADGSVSGPTRTASTVQMYAACGRQLKDRYRREHMLSLRDEPNPVSFANWLLGIRATVKPTTWRVYRQSAISTIQAMDSHEVEQALAMIEAAIDPDFGEARMTHVRRDADGEGERTSSHKAKSITHEQFTVVVRDLPRASNSSYVRALGAWLVAGMATGLRPSEWEAATLSYVADAKANRGKRVYLHVANAKATNGRANGERRTLDLTNLSDEGLEAVERFVEYATDWAHDGAFMKNKNACTRILREISPVLFRSPNGKLLTLYTLRHQFVANMKTIYPHEELAALLGHSTADTQAVWYGKKRSGWAPEHIRDIPAPIEAEVALVRKRFEVTQERLRIKGLKVKAHARRNSRADQGTDAPAPAGPGAEPSPTPSSGGMQA